MTKHANQFLKLSIIAFVFTYVAVAFAAQQITGAVEGSVKKIDTAGRTIVVDTADGSERTFHLAGDLAVHTGTSAAEGASAGLRGIRTGSHVAVHYTGEAGRDSAHEIDNLGDSGLKVVKGTGVRIDRSAKKVTIRTADGSLKTFDLSDRAARDSGKDIAEAGTDTGKAALYYTEDAGRRTVHFIGKTL